MQTRLLCSRNGKGERLPQVHPRVEFFHSLRGRRREDSVALRKRLAANADSS